jgi:hypothetical protein
VKAFVNLSQMTLSQMSETETTGSPEQKPEWLAEELKAAALDTPQMTAV